MASSTRSSAQLDPPSESAEAAVSGDAGSAKTAPGAKPGGLFSRRLERMRSSRVMARLLRNRWAMLSLGYIVFLVVIALIAPLLMTHDPDVQDLAHRLANPSGSHLLGTDVFGRDTYSRLLSAAPVTLFAAAQGLGIAVVLGIPLGLFAGYTGRWADSGLTLVASAFQSLPPLILALAVIGMLGPGLTNAMLAVGITLAPRFFRVARAAAESIRSEPYIEACRSMGVPTTRILWRHVIPNASGSLLVQVSFAVGLVISAEASLSFLGLGVQLPQASWGGMLQGAYHEASRNAFGLVPPAVMITLTIMAFFTLGDGVRDALARSSDG